MPAAQNLIGRSFGRLVAIGRIRKLVKGVFETHYLCHCECGQYKVIKHQSLVSGKVNSCTCLRSELIRKKMTRHGYRYNRLYNVWRNMVDRCVNNKCSSYKNYGGRGIFVCREWKNDISVFVEWCNENGWESGLEIDRIDNNDGYYPENCRFVTSSENSRNTRANRILIYKGESFCMIDLAKKYNIKKSTFEGRLNRGWSVVDAVEVPVKKYSLKGKKSKGGGF